MRVMINVKPAYGPDEAYPTGVDWDIDRDRDLSVYDKPFLDAPDYALATYPAGQWLRVMRDAAPPASA